MIAVRHICLLVAFIVVGLLLLFAPLVKAQTTTQCVEVPELHKIVFVPWIIPVDELIWKWHHAKQPAPEPPECGDDHVLVIGPGFGSDRETCEEL